MAKNKKSNLLSYLEELLKTLTTFLVVKSTPAKKAPTKKAHKSK